MSRQLWDLPIVDSCNYNPTHPKFRTRICRHWLKGHCRLGDACNFAHGWDNKLQYENTAGKPEEIFLEVGTEPVLILDWKQLAAAN